MPQPRLLDEPVAPVRRQGARPPGPAGADVRAHRGRAAGGDRGRARRLRGTVPYIVEEYVDGPEVTVNAVSVDGVFHPLLVTDRAHRRPARVRGRAGARRGLVFLKHKAPIEAARAAAEALGVRNGPTYTQIRVGADGSRVVELAARLGGGHDAELVEAATGVKLNDLALDFALGNEACVSETQSLSRRRLRPLPRRARRGAARGRGARGGARGRRRARRAALPRAGLTSSGRCGAAPTAPAR